MCDSKAHESGSEWSHLRNQGRQTAGCARRRRWAANRGCLPVGGKHSGPGRLSAPQIPPGSTPATTRHPAARKLPAMHYAAAYEISMSSPCWSSPRRPRTCACDTRQATSQADRKHRPGSATYVPEELYFLGLDEVLLGQAPQKRYRHSHGLRSGSIIPIISRLRMSLAGERRSRLSRGNQWRSLYSRHPVAR